MKKICEGTILKKILSMSSDMTLDYLLSGMDKIQKLLKIKCCVLCIFIPIIAV